MDEFSVITLYRRQLLCQITSGAISAMAPVTQIAFGDGGVDGGGNPIPPPETQSTLNNELARYPIDSVTYPIPTTARYMSTIPPGDLVGAAISEAALVDASGNLCAIQNMTVKNKDSGLTFTFTFDDEF